MVYATPLEYDHFGFDNPTQHYLSTQDKVLSLNKRASVIRSDIQDGAETLSYLHQSKSFVDEILFSVPETFRPKIVCSKTYAETVAQALQGNESGNVVNLSGEEGVNYKDVKPNVEITKADTCHHRENIGKLVKKYTGLPRVAASKAWCGNQLLSWKMNEMVLEWVTFDDNKMKEQGLFHDETEQHL